MSAPPTILPAEITAIVRRLRRQIRGYVWLEGLAVVLTWIGVAFWLGLAMDYLPVLAGANELPRAARAVILTVFSIVLVFLVHRFIIRRAFVRLADRSIALLIERRFPEFNDALVTAVDTRIDTRNDEEAALQRAMLQRAVDLASAQSQGLDTSAALRYGPLVRKAAAAAVALLSIGLFGWFAHEAFATWTSRMFLLSDDPWPRRAHIEVMDFPEGYRRVAEGSDLIIQVCAAADRPTPPPSMCTIDFQLKSGDRGRVNMSRDGEPRDGFQLYRYQGPPFQGMFESIEFDVIGSDDRVSDLRVEVVARPSIVDVQLEAALPDYMQQPSRQLCVRPGTSLPVGTAVTITAQGTKPLQQVTVEHLESGQRDVIDVGGSDDTSSFAYHLGPLLETTTLEFSLLDFDEVTSEQPYRITINALEDLPPQLEINLQGIGSAITPQAQLPIQGSIRDDYQIREAWFELDRVDDETTYRAPFDVEPDGTVLTSLDLRQRRNDNLLPWPLQPGDHVVLNVRASDYCDLDNTPHIGQADPVPLEVVTPQELLALLEARELNLKRRFEQTLSEMLETRDALLRLQASLVPADSNPQEPVGDAESSSAEAAVDDVEDSTGRDSSLRRLRVQRAQQQGIKSQQEVQGVATSFAEIRDELVNNRIDTPQRRERLQEQIITPLEVIVADEFERWLDQLAQLELKLEVLGPDSVQQTASVVEQTNELILSLQQVLEGMLELETFNELLDLVRTVLEEQDGLLEATKNEQKRQARALLED